MIHPDYREFSRLARQSTLVPVVKSITADLLTPVSAFLAIAAREPNAFLLESVERGEQIGRYTFLGAQPYMRLEAQRAASGQCIANRKRVAATAPSRSRAGTTTIHRWRRRLLQLRYRAAVGEHRRPHQR